MRIISICSGKGGVGKTSIATNIAAALHMLYKNAIIIDCNLTTPHIGMNLGKFGSEKTVNSALRGDRRLDQCINFHESGIKFIASSLELSDLTNLNTDILKQKIKESFGFADFVIIDSAPGIGKEALISIKSADEVIFVANPYIQSVVDILKTKDLSNRLGFQNMGIVLNRVKNKKHELSAGEIMRFTELPIIATIPEDDIMLQCSNSTTIPVHKYPKSPACREILRLACRISGINCRM
jgi:MinD-like ATPase involved in chromosome partitioning or flagellar assembly